MKRRIKSQIRPACGIWFISILSYAAWGSVVAPTPHATRPTALAETNIAPIAATDLAAQAESTLASLRAMETESTSDPGIKTIEQELPGATEEVAARSEENARILANNTSLELFGRLETSWLGLNQEFLEWQRSVNRHATQLQDQLRHLESLAQSWQLTQESQTGGTLPKDLLNRVTSVRTEISAAHEQVSLAFAATLTLQNQLTEQETRVRDSLAAIEQARRQAMRHLFVRDGPPLWSFELRTNTPQNITIQSQSSLARQWTELRSAFGRKAERFFAQALLCCVLAYLLARAHRKLSILGLTDDALEPIARKLGAPVSAALLLCLAASPWIYSDAPRMLWSILGIAAVIPALTILRRLLTRNWSGTVKFLACLYLVDQLRTVAASQHTLWRFLFTLELVAALLYTLVLLSKGREWLWRESARRAKLVRTGLRICAALLFFAITANGLGYERLSSIVGNTVFSAAYLGVLLFAGVELGEAIMAVVLHLRPFSHLKSVQSHSALILGWCGRSLRWVAIGLWLLFLLDQLALRQPLLVAGNNALHARFAIGTLKFTVGHLLLFAFVLWGAYFASRMLQFVLEKELYPRVRMAPGLNYSISRTVHYAVLLIGFLVALALLGFNLTKLTILAGAFGVGLGFGMQNIVSNFVSGIILLFERPVKVGDVIQFDGAEGVVKRIGMRASVVRASNGSEVIVPNAKLISDPVTNWTFSQRRRLVSMPIAVASDIEPKRVMDILRRVAGGHPSIAKDGPVQTLLTSLNNGTASYELRAWTDQSDNWEQVRSDLLILVKASLATEKIAMR